MKAIMWNCALIGWMLAFALIELIHGGYGMMACDIIVVATLSVITRIRYNELREA